MHRPCLSSFAKHMGHSWSYKQMTDNLWLPGDPETDPKSNVQVPYGTPSNVPPVAAHQYYGNYNYPPYMNLAQGHMAPYGAYMAPTGYGGYGPQHGSSGYGAPGHQAGTYQQHSAGYGSQPVGQGPSTAASGAFKGAGNYLPQYNNPGLLQHQCCCALWGRWRRP